MLYRILAVAALFFFTACSTGDTPGPAPIRKTIGQNDAPVTGLPTPAPAPQERVVKVGLLVPLTGEAAAIGAALQDAATLAVSDKYGAAAEGQLRIVLVPKDTQSTPAGAAAAARQVIASGAQLIVGPLFSTQVSAVADIARPHGISVITFSNNPEVAGGNVYVFGFLVEQQVTRILNYALNRNLAQVALLAPNNPYGLSVQKTAREVLTRSDLSPAVEAYYNPNTTPAAELDTLAARHATAPLSAILLPESGQKLQATVQGLGTRGIAQPAVRLLGTGLWDDAATLRSGAVTGGWFASSTPERFSAFERRFNEYFGYNPPRISALAYDALALSSALVTQATDGRLRTDAITDPAGYNGPVNGIFRCLPTGICERGLAVLEATPNGAKVIDAAPTRF